MFSFRRNPTLNKLTSTEFAQSKNKINKSSAQVAMDEIKEVITGKNSKVVPYAELQNKTINRYSHTYKNKLSEFDDISELEELDFDNDQDEVDNQDADLSDISELEELQRNTSFQPISANEDLVDLDKIFKDVNEELDDKQQSVRNLGTDGVRNLGRNSLHRPTDKSVNNKLDDVRSTALSKNNNSSSVVDNTNADNSIVLNKDMEANLSALTVNILHSEVRRWVEANLPSIIENIAEKEMHDILNDTDDEEHKAA
ncbi:MAG: DUF2497 domain-containing protein [Alphaproteobacteria bacterium]|nr:DUF2497 domain-containing protein [Rickettsiales bacterium]